METAGLTALRELTLRGLHTAHRTKEPRENDTYLEMFLCSKLESEFASKAWSGNSGWVFTFFSWRSGQLRTCLWFCGTPVLHLPHRPAEASTGSKLKTPKTCQTAASPRRHSLYDAARRYGVSSVFTSGRWEGGSIAALASSLSHRLVVSPLVPI